VVCSEKCRKEYEQFIKKRKMYIYIMYAALLFLIIMVVMSII